MKFTWKVFIGTITIIAVGLSAGGYYLIYTMFQSALERETLQALDENSLLRFAFETAATNYPAKYERLQDITIQQIGASLETGENQNIRFIQIKEGSQILYQSDGYKAMDNIIESEPYNEPSEKLYTVIEADGSYFIYVVSDLNIVDRNLRLETIKDISSIFIEREKNVSAHQRISMLILLIEAAITLALAVWLTRPIKRLSSAAKNMAAGNYDYRLQKISNDELGELTDDFNKMSETLEEKILLLGEEVRIREDFVAFFSHELKTPLTAIIGYAEILALRKLDEEKHFLSADYIYREGKRLEALSFRLLDLTVMKHHSPILTWVNVSSILKDFRQTFEITNPDFIINIGYDSAEVLAEEILIKTLLINLVDNGIKASEGEGRININGKKDKAGYIFTVEDFGCGIPEAELAKITEAFYMIDKSRSRSRQGAGLGLALCAEIAKLHDTQLKFESTAGKGTKASFILRFSEQGSENEVK